MEPGMPEEELTVCRQVHIFKINMNTLLNEFLLYNICNVLSQLHFLVMFRASVIFSKFVA